MIKAIPKRISEVIDNNENLSRYLDNLSLGKNFTKRSWLYENVSPEKILENWMHHLQALENGDDFERNVYQFDTSQLTKWGPQGGVKPIDDLLKEIVLPTFSKAKPASAFKTVEWREAKDIVRYNFLSKRHMRAIRPAALTKVLDDMRARDTLESNSGYPDFARRNLPYVKAAALAAAENGEWENYPALALFRNYNNKTRLVWMFPMAANVNEGSYCQPVQNGIVKSQDPFYSPWIGFEEVRKLITTAYDSGKYIYATDFSKTDEHFTIYASDQVLDVLEPLFISPARNGLCNSVERMHNIPLVIGPTRWIVGQHGVASGSNWTNFIETVFDEIFSEFVRTHTGVSGLYAIGDDMAWVDDNYDDAFPTKAEKLGKMVGQIVNAEKVTAQPDQVKTLQRLFQRGYRRPDGMLRGVYSTIRALKSSVFPEKFHKPSLWNSDMFCARQYMILENCVDHPLFEEFVKFVVKGQKDLIPFARKSSADLDRILRETKLLPGFNPTYNQERRDTSLSNFASIAIAAKL